ncbi:UvrD-helicase domain-containing protein [Roseomonas sp. NAR14]|uniref:DNA 3'-5' helicase II n=1 Tax=Roseomonas acroporae TaxID=2937791 RepID=A0A9X1YAZ5_9PROT|nr:UvrD-helicase domain-containing protein [Roseomonas acroporae]MCK8786786.1 UvrD-helicase domain-containing protein [Roseomonas acroporae]
MKFLGISRQAVEEIISDRFLQSMDFEAGVAFADFLMGRLPTPKINSKLILYQFEDGCVIGVVPSGPSQYIVFDVEASGIFGGRYRPAEVLLHLQKTLRFCAKMWANLKPSSNERFLTTSTKAVVFPYPISQRTSVRVSLELSPDSKRLAKRGDEARFVLVYRCGTDDSGGPHEDVRVTNFRKFLEILPAINQSKITPTPEKPKITSISVTALDAPANKLEPYQGYERWRHLLTTRQKEFVDSELDAPHRIEGPAGTGKTLCLILKCITSLKNSKNMNREERALFVTHSDATRRSVQSVFETNDEDHFEDGEKNLSRQSLKIITLQQLCGELLRQDISESEFIDRDAMESKQLQLLYVHEAFVAAMKEDFPTHQRFLSPSFGYFLTNSDQWTAAEIIAHEISVIIKGRSEEKLDSYRKMPRLKYGLPVEEANDRSFVWQIFKRYQKQLQQSAQFDTDDIVLTTIGQLNTPIWRRRRLREGYDSIFIDETHLFNLNELSLFHHLPRQEASYPIAYSVDRAQAIGDRGWTDESFDHALTLSDDAPPFSKTEVISVFRCSPEIVDLAFSVTAAGATLFTNFNDPLRLANSTFTIAEERMCARPIQWLCDNDEVIIEGSFARAEKIARELNVPRGNIALVAFSDDLFKEMQLFVAARNKPVEILKERGDTEAVKRALIAGRYILTTPDYVGGLEFHAVMLLGVDEGRVPPAYTSESLDSRNFLSYASHNRLYVAITRARYRVEVLIERQRGASLLLKNAISNGLIDEAIFSGE